MDKLSLSSSFLKFLFASPRSVSADALTAVVKLKADTLMSGADLHGKGDEVEIHDIEVDFTRHTNLESPVVKDFNVGLAVPKLVASTGAVAFEISSGDGQLPALGNGRALTEPYLHILIRRIERTASKVERSLNPDLVPGPENPRIFHKQLSAPLKVTERPSAPARSQNARRPPGALAAGRVR